MRRPIIAGNWKMNKTIAGTKEMITALAPLVKDADCDVVLCVPFTNIQTAKKAAILVTSTKGADITTSGNDITGVTADSTHLVWVDEGEAYVDSFAEVTVKDKQGEPIAGALTIEGITAPVATVNGMPYTTLQAAIDNAEDGDIIELLKDATIEAAVAGRDTDLKGVNINGNEKTLTVTGTGGGLANVNLIDVTIVDETCYTYENGENAWEFTYLEFSGENTFTNVAFTDGIMFDGTNTITDCSFSGHNNDSSDKGSGAEKHFGYGRPGSRGRYSEYYLSSVGVLL